MSEHYTRNTLEVTAWCKPCSRNTQHRVDAGRLGPCLEHGPKVDANGLSKTQAKRRAKAAAEHQQQELFAAQNAAKLETHLVFDMVENTDGTLTILKDTTEEKP
jgi:hypothetical protein